MLILVTLQRLHLLLKLFLVGRMARLFNQNVILILGFQRLDIRLALNLLFRSLIFRKRFDGYFVSCC